MTFATYREDASERTVECYQEIEVEARIREATRFQDLTIQKKNIRSWLSASRMSE